MMRAKIREGAMAMLEVKSVLNLLGTPVSYAYAVTAGPWIGVTQQRLDNSSQTYLKFPRSNRLGELVGRVSEDCGDPAGVLIRVNERRSLDAIAALPTDRERGIGFLDLNRFALALSSQPCCELIGGVEQPGIAGIGGEQDQLTG